MALCAQVVTLSGTDVVSPVALPEGSACTQYVLMTAEEFQLATANPFVLPVADAITIALSIGAVWAVAFGIRAIVAVLDQNPNREE
jgi:hypothetical protein